MTNNDNEQAVSKFCSNSISRRLKNVVFFFQLSISFVLSRKPMYMFF